MWQGIIVVAVILLVVAIIGYWYNENETTMPSWIWAVFVVAVILFVVAMVTSGYKSTVS